MATPAGRVGKSAALLERPTKAIKRHAPFGQANFADDTPVKMHADGYPEVKELYRSGHIREMACRLMSGAILPMCFNPKNRMSPNSPSSLSTGFMLSRKQHGDCQQNGASH
ncbi:MAG: hypothetical protein ACI9IV_001399 [Paracoccaceae bacterium]|jgi:hypothetical protein